MCCRGSTAWNWRCGGRGAAVPFGGYMICSPHAIAMRSACLTPLKPWRMCGRNWARARRATHRRGLTQSSAGTRRGDARGARLPARARAYPARGRPRHGQDVARAHARARARRAVRAHSVHPGPDARRHHRDHVAHGRPAILVSTGSDIRRSRPGGCNQSRSRENTGRAARGDAGADRHHRRSESSPVVDLHGVRDTEPDRVRRHLSIARGRVGQVHGEGAGRISVGRCRAGNPQPLHRRLRSGSPRYLRREPGRQRRRPRVTAPAGGCGAGRTPDHGIHHGDRARDARSRVADPGRQPAGRRRALQGGTRRSVARRPRLRHPGRREAAGARDPAASRQCRARARARGRHGGSGAQSDSGPDRGSDRVNLQPLLLPSAAIAAFVALWYALGSVAGILWTPRALLIGGLLSLAGVAGFWTPWGGWGGGLDVMLLADVVLLLLIWLDATLAQTVVVTREPLPALSVGHPGEVTYRWTNPAARRARLQVREVRPDILGGAQPPRAVRIPPRSVTPERVPVIPRRRGRETGGAGGFVLDSIGPLGLGRHRVHVPLPWDVVVYPPLVSVRLRASVAEALRRRDAGIKPIRRLGEGRLFESLREWVPGDDLRHIDWKATARRAKVITRQYEAERRQQVLLVLDTGRLMTADVASGVARLDFAVQAALELAYAAAQHDDNVGIMTFADGVQHFVAPERGRTGVRRGMDVLAEVQPKLVEPDYPGAFRYLAARNRKRALTVF